MTQRPIKVRMWCETTQQYFYEPQQVLFCLANASAEPELYEDMVWEQFTGALDSEGKEIYEGDVLRIYRNQKGFENFHPVFVQASEDIAALILSSSQGPLSGTHAFLTKIRPDFYEIIGNIHENKELLK